MFFRTQRAISDLSDDVAALKRKVNTLEATFDDTLAQLQRTYRNNARTLRRIQDVEEVEAPDSPPSAGPAGTDPISARILARRQRLMNPEGTQ